MAHSINGIITSFKYDGEFPNIVLVGNYHFIPFNNKYGRNYYEKTLDPYEELTKETRKVLKELSFKGKCAYVETDYFGGSGCQISEVWESGKKIIGPLISYDNIDNPKIPKGVTVVDNSINDTLKIIGIYKHDGKDEFDSVGLNSYRSNDKIIEEYKKQSNTM